MQNILGSVQHTVRKMKERLSENDGAFIERIFAEGIDKYSQRLKGYNFVNKSTVLDAGCGFGQWSVSLSYLNSEVYSCDISKERVEFLNEVCEREQISNIKTVNAPLTKLPYEDNFFDVVFCYGVIFITDWKKSLKELIRVLKPNGSLYVSANGVGWYLYLWDSEHNQVKGYDPKLNAALAFQNTLNYQRNLPAIDDAHVIVEPNEMIREAKLLGLSNAKFKPEGFLSKNSKPFVIGTYKGNSAVYEILGQKDDVPTE